MKPALNPAEILSTESARESRAASPAESICTSFLFTFWEISLVVKLFAALLCTDRASYSLYMARESKIRKERNLVTERGRRKSIRFPAIRENVNVSPEISAIIIIERRGICTFPAL